MHNEAQRRMDGQYSEIVRQRGYTGSEMVFYMFNWLPRRRNGTEENKSNI